MLGFNMLAHTIFNFLCRDFSVLASVLSADGDFTPSFCFVRFLPRFFKRKLQFAPIMLEVKGVKFVAK